MDVTKTMLRTIINGQSSIKSELLVEIKKISKRVDSLENKMDKGFKDLKLEVLENRKRIDKLVNRVAKIEQKIAFA